MTTHVHKYGNWDVQREAFTCVWHGPQDERCRWLADGHWWEGYLDGLELQGSGFRAVLIAAIRYIRRRKKEEIHMRPMWITGFFAGVKTRIEGKNE